LTGNERLSGASSGALSLGRAALIDLDGTLVDTNYQHALAWYRAFRRHQILLPVWRIHRHVGMGGDLIVAALAGNFVERRLGDVLRELHDEEFLGMRDECEPFDGVVALIDELRDRAIPVVLASSASGEDLDYFLAKLGIRDLIAGCTTADDTARSKPHPDVVTAALKQVPGDDAVMIGDSRWDVEAASRAGLPTVGLTTGGWAAAELLEAGAVAVFDSLDELRRQIDTTPLGRHLDCQSPSKEGHVGRTDG
jgi:HAD superfamily hydrolase (TIGR01549 family)